MIIKQTHIFKRRIKKMHPAEKNALDDVVKKIIADPALGDLKTGDLLGIQVYKYKFNSQQYLLAYCFVEDELLLTFIEHGSHENFYRDLKR